MFGVPLRARGASDLPRALSDTPVTIAAMNATAIVDRLERFPSALRASVAIAADVDLRWKPAPEHWSILEICRHLLDEEREDFRVRIESTLADPTRAWPPLALDGIAEARRYNEADPAETVDAFAAARAANIAWLRSLGRVDWSIAHQHPRIGPIAAGDLLAAWTAHDALHLRQIAKRLHNLAERDGGPHTIRYAGEWTA